MCLDGSCDYDNVQDAIDAAVSGDVIKMATGVYTDADVSGTVPLVKIDNKRLTLRGGYSTSDWEHSYPITQPTTLDAEGKGQVMYLDWSSYPRQIEGLILTGGSAARCAGLESNDHVILRHNVISGNVAQNNGGLCIYGFHAEMIVEDNIIQHNQAITECGGVYASVHGWGDSGLTFNRNQVTHNQAQRGAGMCLGGSNATVVSNTIQLNHATARGGGLYLSGSQNNTHLQDNQIVSNTALEGGGVYFAGYNRSRWTGNTIGYNQAGGIGAGLVITNSSQPDMVNNLVVGNSLSQTTGLGAAFYLANAQPLLRHNTVVKGWGGDGSGFHLANGATVNLSNTIVVSFSTGISASVGTTATLQGTLWYSNSVDSSGGGNVISSTSVFADPLFADWSGDDFHLTLASPARDAGDDAGVLLDFEGDKRDNTPDLGYDELALLDFYPHNSGSTAPGNALVYQHTLDNLSSVTDSYTLTLNTAPQFWGIEITPTHVSLAARESAPVTVTVTVPYTAVASTHRTWITATSQVYGVQMTVYDDTTVNAIAGTRYVTPDGVDNTNCLTYTAPCRTPQYAVDQALNSDTIKMATGVYTDADVSETVPLVRIENMRLTLRGGYSTSDWEHSYPITQPTTLDAEGKGQVMYLGWSWDPRQVEGLILTGGSADRCAGLESNDHVILRHNVISGNVAQNNGGLCISGGGEKIIVEDNIIQHNQAITACGGVYASFWGWGEDVLTFNRNQVTDNQAQRGAGMCLQWTENITVISNTIQLNHATARGGGLYLSGSQNNTHLQDNQIVSNTALEGGGVYFADYNRSRWTGNTIGYNQAGGIGAGLVITDSSQPDMINNLVVGNSLSQTTGMGAAFYLANAHPLLRHNTVVKGWGGDGSGFHLANGATVNLSNTIVVSFSTGISATAGTTATFQGTLWYSNSVDSSGGGNVISSTNVFADPLFAGDGLHLTSNSPARDAGVDAGVTTDIDGDPRPHGAGYDIGADEHIPSGVAFAPNHTAQAQPGDIVTFTHTLTNTGDITDTFDLTHHSSQGWTVNYDTPIALGLGQTSTLVISVTVPAGSGGLTDTMVMTAISQRDSNVQATVTDTTTVSHTPGVSFAPDKAQLADPGSIVTYTHTLTNTGNGPDIFDLTYHNDQDWTVELGGLYPSGTAHLPWQMNAGMTATIVVSVTIPTDAISGTVDTTTITATSQADSGVYAMVNDTTEVSQIASVQLGPDRADSAEPSSIVTYTHILTNTGNGPDVFDLTHHSSQTWTVAYDTPVSVGYGQTATVIVSVTIPTDAISSTVDTTTITATSQADSGVYAMVNDTTEVSQIASVQLGPDRADSAEPGSIVTYTHILTNTGNGPDVFDLTYHNDQDWTVELGGLYPSGTAHLPWQMNAGMTATIVVSVTVPTDAISGTVGSTFITATSQLDSNVFDKVTNVITVGRVYHNVYLPLVIKN